MSIFKKKSKDNSVLTDNYVPASLTTYGLGLENYVPADYPMNIIDNVKKLYEKVAKIIANLIPSCDHNSPGSVFDPLVDAQTETCKANHEAAIANHENQVTRIQSARKMRKAALERKISSLEEKTEKLQKEIEPLEGLYPQFQLHIGRRAISVGLPITIACMIIDAFVNYSFLSAVLLSNAALLMITVICMSAMSDLSMFVLGLFISHSEEKFISKSLFWAICIGLVSMFLLSVAASVMIRFGSMDATYGVINAAGEFIGKESYSLAEYGITLMTSFVTTCTGLLSFAFSVDKNAFLVSVREGKKKEQAKCLARLELLLNELKLIDNSPDPQTWDERKRTAAEHQIEANRIGLKLYSRMLMADHIKDADFTERMAAESKELLERMAAESKELLFSKEEAAPADISEISARITRSRSKAS